MMKKVFALLMALMMVLGMGSAFAADETATTTNGTYTDGEWVAGGNGIITHTIDGTEVALSKTATPATDAEDNVIENVFDITLQVQTSTTTTSTVPGGAVVLVIDTSSSMKSCAECGGRDNHNNNCKYYQSGFGANNSVSSAQNRLTAAKNAAKNFLATYAGDDDESNRMISLVTFDAEGETVISWINVAGGNAEGKANASNYNDVASKIEALGYKTGTHMQGGLEEALALVKSSSISPVNVVLLSDGAPSLHGTETQVGSPTYNDAAYAVTAATNVKAENAYIYTVCFGAANDSIPYSGNGNNSNSTVSTFLSTYIASQTPENEAEPVYAYDADDSAELNEAFEAIGKSITSGLTGDGWTATDPMGDKVAMVTETLGDHFKSEDNSDTYTWTLKDRDVSTTGNVTTYTYTYTYRIELDVLAEDFTAGTYYPTNKATYLNVDGKKYAFPVPGVSGRAADFKVYKEDSVSHAKLDGVEFTLSHADDCGCKLGSASFKGKTNGDGLIVFENDMTAIPSGHSYILRETEYPGYETNTSVKLSVAYNAENNKVEITFVDESEHFTGENGVFTMVNDPVLTEVTVTKEWDDNDDQDGIRPASVTVKLLADGAETNKTIELNADNEWTGKFTELNKYSVVTGENDKKVAKEIVYTVDEVEVAGYTPVVTGSAADGYIITNTHTPEKTSVTVNKVWDDKNNQDGIRPASVKVQLYANGTEYGEAVELNETGKWTYTWADLDKKASGKDIAYTVDEVEVPTGYKKTVDGTKITNTHAPEKTSVTVNKVWDDKDNQDGIRPASVKVQLYANGTEYGEAVELNETGKWTYTWDGLDKKASGKDIAYTVDEVEVPAGYSKTVDGTEITNTHAPEKTSVTVNKVWDDKNNQDGIRPASVKVQLHANGTAYGEAVELNETGKWTYTWDGLDKKADGEDIVYTVTEESVANYTPSIEGTTITNSYTPGVTSVTVTKSWDDNNNQDGIRPTSIQVQLYADEEAKGDVVTLNKENNWTYTWNNLDLKSAGKEIKYTVDEVIVPDGYTKSIKGTVITNTHTPVTTEVAGTKTWDDADNQDGKRPESITINLLANGKTVKTATVTAEDGWKYKFTDLPKFEAGVEIGYTIAEDAVPGYTAVVSEDGYNVTNTHEIEKINIVGSKTWVGDTADMRPESITINLLADGVEKDEVVVTAADEWTWSFENLDKYQAGKEIVYTITEDAIDYYTATVDGYNVINTRNEVAAQSFNVTKKIEKTGAVAPVPGTYTFDFTVMAKKAEAPAMFMARQVVPNNNVTIQIDGGEQKTVAIGQPVTFSIDVEVTETGAEWKNTSKVNFWLNGEDAEGVAFEVVETSTAPKYWTYDNTAKTVALDNLEAGAVITNKYNEGYITTQIPVTKTVVQAGNIVPGVNTFYYELLFVTENRDKLNVSVVAAEDSIGKVVDLHNDQFSMTVDGAGQTSAYVVVQYPESADFKGILLLEKTSADGSVTMAELETAGWIYDKSATREPMEDGSTLIYPWFIDLNEDGSVTIHNAEDQPVDSVNIVNTYTASTPPPKTGDNSNIALWLALMSASALCFVIISKRRNA